MTYFQVQPGQEVESGHMNAAIRQGVPPFTNTSERDAAIPAPAPGQLCTVLEPWLQTFMADADGSWRLAGGVVPWALSSWSGLTLPAAPAPISAAPLSTADVAGGCAISPSTGHVTIPHDGRYQLAAAVAAEVVGSALGSGIGTPTVRTDGGYEGGLSNSKATVGASITRAFEAGDVVCPWAWAIGGVGAENQAWMAVTWVGMA